MDHQIPGSTPMLITTFFLWVVAHITPPSWSDMANMATVFAGVTAGVTYIYNAFLKKKK